MSSVRYIAVDVECAASGRGHNDRVPCWVAAVDENYNTLLDIVIKCDNVFSPMTSITGLTLEEINNGVPLDEAIDRLRSICGPDVVFVGQRVSSDINWMQLRQGVDYQSIIDLAEEFRTFNSRFNRYDYASLRQLAYVLLDQNIQEAAHSPVTDSVVSMRLFNEHAKIPYQLEVAKQKILTMRKSGLIPRYPRAQEADVCSSAFNPNECFCGQSMHRQN
eukprot:TRINITY_DN2951_c0_g1_i1.p1 TRINITY_DN2951_c0_g1~~TRINITY_DN2951_c0_g1_i1.p1  ORF type:complete len:219 (+),score=4.98 TRINITY_DN2951_c0_g1_i1:74-730(+)